MHYWWPKMTGRMYPEGWAKLAALIIFAAYALRETWISRTQSALALAAFLATVSLLSHQLVDDLFFYPKVAGLFWVLLGAGVAAQPADAGKGAKSPES
jgi:hypothetical protein